MRDPLPIGAGVQAQGPASATLVASFLVRAAAGEDASALATRLAARDGISASPPPGLEPGDGRLVVVAECDATEAALDLLLRSLLAEPGVADVGLVSAFTDDPSDLPPSLPLPTVRPTSEGRC